jgi:hypothetical protein
MTTATRYTQVGLTSQGRRVISHQILHEQVRRGIERAVLDGLVAGEDVSILLAWLRRHRSVAP